MTALVVQGDAAHLPLPDASVDLIVTSPPYFALRSYTDAGEHYRGQIGSEPTPAEYLDALWACTREWMRVLKPEGSLWVNLGDKYAGGGGFAPNAPSNQGKPRRNMAPKDPSGFSPKTLLGIPWRYAIGCIDQLGLILRAELIWSKPNGLPESVTDRVRRSHEQWFHLVAQPRYYSAVDEIREAHAPDSFRLSKHSGQRGSVAWNAICPPKGRPEQATHPLGKLPGSVWSIPSEPLQVPPGLGVDHFAAFPTEWPRRLILGWSPPGICTACGQGRRPVTQSADATWSFAERTTTQTTITGYACACTPYTDHPGSGESSGPGYGDCLLDGGYPRQEYNNNSRGETSLQNRPKVGPWREFHFDAWTPAPTTPAVILDPFGGTGTTALVAHALGRTGISVDMSGDYSRLARWRTTDRGELARALRVAKPAKPVDGQLDMFEVGA